MSNHVELNTLSRYHKWRMSKDAIAKHSIAIGGMMVIVSLVSIFGFLLSEAIPMFASADVEQQQVIELNTQGQPSRLLALDEYAEIALVVNAQGDANYYATQTGELLKSQALFDKSQHQMTAIAKAAPVSGVFLIGFENGSVLAYKNEYKISFGQDNQRTIVPNMTYPFGESLLPIDAQGAKIDLVSGQLEDDEASIAVLTADQRVILAEGRRKVNFMTGAGVWKFSPTELETDIKNISQMLINVSQNLLVLANPQGALHVYSIRDKAHPKLLGQYTVKGGIKALSFLSAGNSLIISSADGELSQWFHVKDEHNHPVLTKIRTFGEQTSVVSQISPEYARKGFLTIDQQGRMGLHHATAGNTLIQLPVADTLTNLTMAPRANAALVEDGQGKLHVYRIENPHPEISWSVLWGKVWYEDYQKPEYVWQSSSASNDFEPKFSLVPITFGTLKAAMYAMIIAVPLAIFGAIYTAYFMTPSLRKIVKPGIEIMEALPTVILGFLAGLWLAPMMEEYLPAFIVMLFLLPLGTLLFAYLWTWLPESIRLKMPEGYQALLLVPAIIFLVWFSFFISPGIEMLFFEGDIRNHITNVWGVDYSQRNALVVGLAMGFAVVPTIFSIAEDAIFAVPKHLTVGSLALGATPWQTLTRVVILNASPGIFSAVMMGLGRAVGETMIVLMATGNTPIMDWNIFEGFRTLSANIAEEMPESEVSSTHYRVLFLAALVLFVVTFMLNTVAEVVRQRLRKKFTSI